MRHLALALALLLLFPAEASEDFYCDDPATAAEWSRLATQYAGSDDWQRMHALWLGLCQKVREGSISQSRATALFERDRAATVRKMRRRMEQDFEGLFSPAG